jgi:hypothetical protein
VLVGDLLFSVGQMVVCIARRGPYWCHVLVILVVAVVGVCWLGVIFLIMSRGFSLRDFGRAVVVWGWFDVVDFRGWLLCLVVARVVGCVCWVVGGLSPGWPGGAGGGCWRGCGGVVRGGLRREFFSFVCVVVDF